MPEAAPDWIEYNRWNRRDERMAELWVRDLVAWLSSAPELNETSTVLDFGCGYFDVGMAIARNVARVDGSEIEPRTVELARSRSAELPATRIFESGDAIQPGTYDFIVVNSVVQYFGGVEDLRKHLRLFHEWLKPGPRSAVLIADVIPPEYSAAKDALRSLRVALCNGMLPAMVRHLWKAAFKAEKMQLLRIGFEPLQALASEAGFTCERLNKNLTPSRRRYTCLFKRGELV